MKIIELILDEENEDGGITAISLVENPAIEENFIALKSEKYELAEVDKEKRLLMGVALIPNKPIFKGKRKILHEWKPKREHFRTQNSY